MATCSKTSLITGRGTIPSPSGRGDREVQGEYDKDKRDDTGLAAGVPRRGGKGLVRQAT